MTDGVTSDPQSLVNLFWEAVCARAHVGMHVCGLAGNGADCGKEVRVMQRQDSSAPSCRTLDKSHGLSGAQGVYSLGGNELVQLIDLS